MMKMLAVIVSLSMFFLKISAEDNIGVIIENDNAIVQLKDATFKRTGVKTLQLDANAFDTTGEISADTCVCRKGLYLGDADIKSLVLDVMKASNFVCKEGYTGQLCDTPLKCTGNNADAPSNGKVSLTAENNHGSVATFSCNDGFEYSGDASIKCVAGTADAAWPKPSKAPTCTAVKCSIANSNTKAGTDCACNDGFSGTITWKGTTPSGTCTAAACKIANSNEKAGKDCACNSGYTLAQKLDYKGCWTGASDWVRQSKDVPSTHDGAVSCGLQCYKAGYPFFGLECPHDDGKEVHCQCTKTLKSTKIEDQKCREFNSASGSHCSGPFEAAGALGTFYLGAGVISSAYSTEMFASAASVSYQGCWSGASDWVRPFKDVPSTYDGAISCGTQCATAGYTYFGLECPHDNGKEVHCQCTKTLKSSKIDDQKCREFNSASGAHCSGPFEVKGDMGTLYLGAGSISSAYTTASLTSQPMTWDGGEPSGLCVKV